MTPEEAAQILEEGGAEIAMLMAVTEEKDFVRRGAIGGGEWSPKDLLAHLTFCERNALDALEDWSVGREWRLHHALRVSGDEDFLNDRAVKESLSLDPDEVRDRAGKTHSELLAAVGAMTEVEWKTPAGDGTRGFELGSIIGGPDGPFRHAWAHLGDLREYVESLG